MSFSHPGILNSTKPWPTISFSPAQTPYSDSTYYYYRLPTTGTLTVSNAPLAADVLLVGGGGGGGFANDTYYHSAGGGGGAGDFSLFENVTIAEATTATYQIGAGGATGVVGPLFGFGDPGPTSGRVGSPTTFSFNDGIANNTYSAAGGGGGAGTELDATPGGSGGGAGGRFGTSPATIAGAPVGSSHPLALSFKNAGGSSSRNVVSYSGQSILGTSFNGGAGGGGAGAAGQSNSQRSGGDGGTGKIAFDFSGSSLFKVAGGGGGGGNGINPGLNYFAAGSREFGGGWGETYVDSDLGSSIVAPTYYPPGNVDRDTWAYPRRFGEAGKGGGGGGSSIVGYNLSHGNAGWTQLLPSSGGSGVAFIRIARSNLGE
jgi:hypothetical protein